MSDVSVPAVPKWPFLLGDALLLGVAGFIGRQCHAGALPASPAYVGLIVGSVGLGAWMLCRPFLREHEAAVMASERSDLAGTLAQVRQLEAVGQQVTGAAAQLGASGKQLGDFEAAAKELVARLAEERAQLAQAFQRANDQEKQVARLEIDKLRRSEQEGLQVVVHLLDHTFALFQAGARSGQPGLIQQLGNFRGACLEAVRRLGLVSHEAEPGAPFNPDTHETHDGSEAAAGSPIAGTFACGYTFRGAPLRRIVVVTQAAAEAAQAAQPSGGPTESPGAASGTPDAPDAPDA